MVEVTRHPTAEWLARQITEAFPWSSAPTYLVRDNDRAYGYCYFDPQRNPLACGLVDRADILARPATRLAEGPETPL